MCMSIDLRREQIRDTQVKKENGMWNIVMI
jgi:hypothetical protein